ncbi:MAG: 30S ribosomal protein S13 [Dehalococcoidia bacterium]|nr:30S ribosomal protein S13 [Dehalococcoidia bacterium]
MAIIAGVNIPDNKRLEVALTKLYGIGPTNSKRIVREVGLEHNPRVRDLKEEDLARIRSAIDRAGILIEGDLRREVQMNIRRLIDIQAYRGLRHRRSLPTRGQRTRTNARTRRGNKRLTVAGRKKTPTKG